MFDRGINSWGVELTPMSLCAFVAVVHNVKRSGTLALRFQAIQPVASSSCSQRYTLRSVVFRASASFSKSGGISFQRKTYSTPQSRHACALTFLSRMSDWGIGAKSTSISMRFLRVCDGAIGVLSRLKSEWYAGSRGRQRAGIRGHSGLTSAVSGGAVPGCGRGHWRPRRADRHDTAASRTTPAESDSRRPARRAFARTCLACASRSLPARSAS